MILEFINSKEQVVDTFPCSLTASRSNKDDVWYTKDHTCYLIKQVVYDLYNDKVIYKLY